MAGTDWSFSLLSNTGFPNNVDCDEDNEENLGDTGTSSRFSSGSSQILQQIDLAAREDSAQFNPHPWSIARVNAASRPRQPIATVKSLSEKPTAKKPPQGAIVDAFKRQTQKPKTRTKSSAQPNQLPTPSQQTVLTSVAPAPDNLVHAPARPPSPIAHIATPVASSMQTPSEQTTLQQHQSPPSPYFLPRKAFSVSQPVHPASQSQNPHFSPSLKRAPPLSSPGFPHPRSQCFISSTSNLRGAPSQDPTHVLPHILEFQTTPGGVHLTANHVAPIPPSCRGDKNLTRSSPHHPTPVKPERKKISSHPHLDAQFPSPLQPYRPISKASPKSDGVPPSPSFTKARRFFEHNPLPVTAIKQPSLEPPHTKDEPHSAPPPSHIQIASPPRKRADPYDQLPPSPDSEWSTLKPSGRKASGKAKPRVLDAKSGKFRLPLSLGTITPRQPPQKKARVVTYFPPPPPKKQRTMAGLDSGTRDIETGTCMDGILLSSQEVVLSLTCFPLLSVPKSGNSDKRVALSSTFRRNGSPKLTHSLRAVRFKLCIRPLQDRSCEDSSGTYAQRIPSPFVVPFDPFPCDPARCC